LQNLRTPIRHHERRGASVKHGGAGLRPNSREEKEEMRMTRDAVLGPLAASLVLVLGMGAAPIHAPEHGGGRT
jgi:hypothetical protein